MIGPTADINIERYLPKVDMTLPKHVQLEQAAGRAAAARHLSDTHHTDNVSDYIIREYGNIMLKKVRDTMGQQFVSKDNKTKLTSSVSFDHTAGYWTVTLSAKSEGQEPVTIREPLPQFPSDEMKTWLSMLL